ncbi:MAG TPA: M56 family metallopeptidase, partial [Myxococcaceae bacterium]|nr:M56 family metallopeptidase [Myxococcaceae bacterium]
MALVTFLLECAAVAALVSVVASGFSVLGAGLLARLGRGLSPSLRADGTFLLGMLPAGLSLAVLAATAAPPVAAALGLREDHCLGHGEHLHLWLVHAGGPRPVLAVVGGAWLVMVLVRTGMLVWRRGRLGSRLAALEKLGTRREGEFPIISIPGAPHLCHATGLVRRRILLSASLSEALSPEQMRSALAHEAAHLHRRDPLAGVLLVAAGLAVPPLLSRFLLDSWKLAAEEACDAEAARRVGDGSLVAEALVRVALLQQRAVRASGATPAFGELALERRVRLLLDGGGRASASARALVA